MATGDTPPAPFASSLRDLGDNLLGMLQNRVRLASIEIQEEKYRFIGLVIWIFAVLFTGLLALTFVSLTLVYIFWNESRLAVLGGLAGFYTIAVIAMAFGCRRYLARQPRPFAGTEWELEEDRSCIRKKS